MAMGMGEGGCDDSEYVGLNIDESAGMGWEVTVLRREGNHYLSDERGDRNNDGREGESGGKEMVSLLILSIDPSGPQYL